MALNAQPRKTPANSKADTKAKKVQKAKRQPKQDTTKKVRSKSVASADSVVLHLNGPGMTPMLQAGLGGVAASLRAIHLKDRKAKWPARVNIAGGYAEVTPTRVLLHWGADPGGFLNTLFEHAFTLRDGLIHIPAWHRARSRQVDPLLAVELQRALKRTFLQHGKTTEKVGAETVLPVNYGEGENQVLVSRQSYANYAHRKEGSSMVLDALSKGRMSVAGWVCPGATQRHVGFAQSKWEYGLADGLCALFSVVGCISLQASANAGALIVPVPSDLVEFASRRWQMSPQDPGDAIVGGTGDGVLRTMLALRQNQRPGDGRAVRSVSGYILRATPWALQQKNRVCMVAATDFSQEVLDAYSKALSQLPNTLRLRKNSKKGEENYFYSTSALRAFIAENLASGRPWYAGFATARTADKDARFIHYYRTRDNLGALFLDERKGLWAMIEQLDVAEEALVTSVQEALKQRLGAIWRNKQTSLTAKRNKSDDVREEWRLRLANAKTMEQTRHALARIWTEGGYGVQALKEHWREVLPLLRQDRWQTARDLALIGLASYRRSKDDENEDVEDSFEDAE